jgi:hypothetical protein
MGVIPLAVDAVVGLAEQLPALGVAHDHESHIELGQHVGADLPGVGPLGFPVTILGPQGDRDAIGVEHRLDGAQGREGRVDRHVDGVVVRVR